MKSKKQIALVSLVVLAGFYLLTKVLNTISLNKSDEAYQTHCASCHGAQGEGLKDLIPPIANTDWMAQNHAQLPCIIQHGIDDSLLINGKRYHQEMIGLEHLTEIQITNITNYIYKSWGNDFGYVSVDSVNTMLRQCK